MAAFVEWVNANSSDKQKRKGDLAAAKSPRYAVCNYVCTRGGHLVSLVEVKVRVRRFGSNSKLASGYLLSRFKVAQLAQLSVLLRVPSYIVIRFTDCIAFASIGKPDSYDTVRGGRDDRDDRKDIEDMCVIPWQFFRQLT